MKDAQLNPYLPVSGAVVRVITETPTIKTLVIKPEHEIPFRSGQFMQFTMPGVGEAPFTPSSSPNHPETLDFTILNAGTVTGELHQAKEGDRVGLRGRSARDTRLRSSRGRKSWW